MKIGDVVKTKVPGFGTGNVSKVGTIIDTKLHWIRSEDAVTVHVFHEDGTFLDWYPWQLELICSEKEAKQNA